MKVYRQVFALHSEGLYLVNTRIENRSGAEHEYAQFFALPTWLPATGMDDAETKINAMRESGRSFVIKDPERGLLATGNQGRPNVSIHLAANGNLAFGNTIDQKGNHACLPPQLEVMQEALVKYRRQEMSERDFAKRWLSHLGSGRQQIPRLTASRRRLRLLQHRRLRLALKRMNARSGS